MDSDPELAKCIHDAIKALKAAVSDATRMGLDVTLTAEYYGVDVVVRTLKATVRRSL